MHSNASRQRQGTPGLKRREARSDSTENRSPHHDNLTATAKTRYLPDLRLLASSAKLTDAALPRGKGARERSTS